jgi:uncharacterized membrane protein
MNQPVFTNDAVVLGLLMAVLGFVFWGAGRTEGFWRRFYSIVPSILVCYFLPSLLATVGLISGEVSNLYFVASRYLLPASLVLLTLSVDFPGLRRLGFKALILFFTGTLGIVLGGPIAVFLTALVAPDLVGGVGPDAVWRGFTTIAGSWIGGGANQAAMKEVFEVSDPLFSKMVAVDVIIANLWMAVLLFLAGRSEAVDRWSGADASAIHALRDRVSAYQASIAKIPTLGDTMTILAVGFGATAVAHAVADVVAPAIQRSAPQLERFSLTSGFFWIVVLATTLGLGFALTPLRRLEGAGASRIGSVLLYVLVATIGMKMNILAVFENPGLFVVAAIWMLIHITLLLAVARLIRAPLFFVAVGSQANVGGAASAPIVASAFHPALAPVGVLLAVLGYAVGTYGAWLCGQLLRLAAP